MHAILAARSDFSVGESILTIEHLIDGAKEVGASAVAVTDTMSVTAMIDFTNRAKKAGIKPIIGARLRLTDEPTWRPAKGEKKKNMPREYFATAYALTEEGMKSIFRLLTLGASEDRFYYVPKLGFGDLATELRAISAGALALVPGDAQSMLEHPNAEKIIEDWSICGMKVFMPMFPINTPYYGRLNEISIDLSQKLGLRKLLIRPALYNAGEADTQEIMTAIAENQKLTDGWFRSRHNRDMHLMNEKQTASHVVTAARHLEKRLGLSIATCVDHFKEGMGNVETLVDLVEYEWAKAPVSLPQMAPDEFAAVLAECKKGWPLRFDEATFGHKPSADDLEKIYKPRLAYELSILKKLEFSGYFLLVHDIVQFAKSNDILVGPGRGSVGGSLVAYLMGITDCDPIRFGLLFERFINPDRIDLPDADLDFMSERRHEIVDYLITKYGAERVAGVSNFGTLAAASAIRDVSRVAGLGEFEYTCSKYVPKLHGANVPLSECRVKVPEIDTFAKKQPYLWPIMERLEGTIRNFSQHAAGVVVGGVDLVERGVVERRKETAVMCWDKRIVEDQGLVKVDILGLRTLDLIKLTMDYVKERTGKKLDLMRIPLDDKAVLDRFASGQTSAVFQYEGGGARRMLKNMADSGIPLTFGDVAAVSALNRPGPLEAGLDRLYIENREGTGNVSFLSPHMEASLSDTFGAIVYQEQVMQISKDLSGFTGAEADVLRKAIGKKDPTLMAKMKDQFVKGASAGYIEVTLDDGTKKKVHRTRKFKVAGSSEKFTLEDVVSRKMTLLESF